MIKKYRITLLCIFIVLAMTGMSFAAVPLYSLICRQTGFDGTTQRAAVAPATVNTSRHIRVFFDASVANGLPWKFYPLQRSVDVALGEAKTVSYRATNTSKHAIIGTATYNVSPEKVGLYFNKVQCFCFTRQTIQPGQSIDLPVTFFIDESLKDDRDNDDTTEVTLSYTFFEAK